jgi:hypothetical protein
MLFFFLLISLWMYDGLCSVQMLLHRKTHTIDSTATARYEIPIADCPHKAKLEKGRGAFSTLLCLHEKKYYPPSPQPININVWVNRLSLGV